MPVDRHDGVMMRSHFVVLSDDDVALIAGHLELNDLLALRCTCLDMCVVEPRGVCMLTMKLSGKTMLGRYVELSRQEDVAALRFLRLAQQSRHVILQCAVAAADIGKSEVLRMSPPCHTRMASGPLRRTPMMHACLGGHASCVSALLDTGVGGIDKDDIFGMTAIFLAARGSHVACVELLARAGASVNRPTNGNTTPLMIACENGHHACARSLLDALADVHVINDFGRTALDLASQYGHESCTRLLVQASRAASAHA